LEGSKNLGQTGPAVSPNTNDNSLEGKLPSIGPMELMVVLVIALVVLGPKRLPQAGRSLGKGMREFKDGLIGDGQDDGGRPELPNGLIPEEMPPPRPPA
jgi:sec-independent protein translocase protein TatA